MDAILAQLQAHGSLIVGLNVLLQQIGLPIPSVPTMMVAGALKMPAGAFVIASLASAALWVGAAMGVGLVFASQIDVVLAWMTDNAALAVMAVLAAVLAYIGYKAYERYRLVRHVDAARI